MKVIVNVVIVVLVIIILKLFIDKRTTPVTYVNTDNGDFLVYNTSDKEQAAKILSDISGRLKQLISHLKSKFPDKPLTKLVTSRFNPQDIYENGTDHNYTSYTQGKGDSMFFCLRSERDKGVLHDLNLLTFVAVHELAHVATKEYDGHGDMFHKNFKFLLKEAVKINIYKPADYSSSPVNYCGDNVASSPLF